MNSDWRFSLSETIKTTTTTSATTKSTTTSSTEAPVTPPSQYADAMSDSCMSVFLAIAQRSVFDFILVLVLTICPHSKLLKKPERVHVRNRMAKALNQRM